MSYVTVLVAVLFYGGMAALAFLLGSLFDLSSLWQMQPSFPGPLPRPLGPVLGIALGLLTHAASTFVRRRYGWTQGFHDSLREMLGSPSAGQAATLALSSAVAEELLFRGALLPLMGLLPQALIFGILHFGPGREFRFWPLYAAVMGILLGLLYQATGSLLPPILAHFTVNFFGLLSSSNAGKKGSEDQ